MSEPEVGPAVSKLIALAQYRVAAHRREGRTVRSYFRNSENAMQANLMEARKVLLPPHEDPFAAEKPSVLPNHPLVRLPTNPTEQALGRTVDWETPDGWAHKKVIDLTPEKRAYLLRHYWQPVPGSPNVFRLKKKGRLKSEVRAEEEKKRRAAQKASSGGLRGLFQVRPRNG